MKEVFTRVAEVISHKHLVVCRGLTTRDQGVEAAGRLSRELKARAFEGDAADMAGHELSHQWVAAGHGVLVDFGVMVNRFSGKAVGAFTKAHTRDLEILADIAAAPNWEAGLVLTTIRMSEGDMRIFAKHIYQSRRPRHVIYYRRDP